MTLSPLLSTPATSPIAIALGTVSGVASPASTLDFGALLTGAGTDEAAPAAFDLVGSTVPGLALIAAPRQTPAAPGSAVPILGLVEARSPAMPIAAAAAGNTALTMAPGAPPQAEPIDPLVALLVPESPLPVEQAAQPTDLPPQNIARLDTPGLKTMPKPVATSKTPIRKQADAGADTDQTAAELAATDTDALPSAADETPPAPGRARKPVAAHDRHKNDEPARSADLPASIDTPLPASTLAILPITDAPTPQAAAPTAKPLTAAPPVSAPSTPTLPAASPVESVATQAVAQPDAATGTPAPSANAVPAAPTAQASKTFAHPDQPRAVARPVEVPTPPVTAASDASTVTVARSPTPVRAAAKPLTIAATTPPVAEGSVRPLTPDAVAGAGAPVQTTPQTVTPRVMPTPQAASAQAPAAPVDPARPSPDSTSDTQAASRAPAPDIQVVTGRAGTTTIASPAPQAAAKTTAAMPKVGSSATPVSAQDVEARAPSITTIPADPAPTAPQATAIPAAAPTTPAPAGTTPLSTAQPVTARSAARTIDTRRDEATMTPAIGQPVATDPTQRSATVTRAEPMSGSPAAVSAPPAASRPTQVAQAQPVPDVATAAPTTPVPAPAQTAQQPTAPAPPPTNVAADAPTTPMATGQATVTLATGPDRHAAPPAPQPAAPATPAPVTQGPAIQVFGAAIAAAQRDERTANDRNTLESTTAPLQPATETARAVAATGAAQQAPLDMRQERWPHSMVDRIEHLRDTAAAISASAADTKIRLVPDALGTIDVSITRDGDSVSVRFQAEHAATRALLQDQQGRLADIAESRGLRLSGSSVDAGSAQAGQQHQPQQQAARQPTIPGAPPRASTSDPATTDTVDDGRVA